MHIGLYFGILMQSHVILLLLAPLTRVYASNGFNAHTLAEVPIAHQPHQSTLAFKNIQISFNN